jgi:hypothetical protein
MWLSSLKDSQRWYVLTSIVEILQEEIETVVAQDG